MEIVLKKINMGSYTKDVLMVNDVEHTATVEMSKGNVDAIYIKQDPGLPFHKEEFSKTMRTYTKKYKVYRNVPIKVNDREVFANLFCDTQTSGGYDPKFKHDYKLDDDARIY